MMENASSFGSIEGSITERSVHDLEDSDGEWDSDREEDIRNSICIQQSVNTDPGLELGQWLGQLEALSHDLENVRPRNMPVAAAPESPATLATPQVKMRPQTGSKPALPPKPPIDCIRYSQANLEDSSDVDLDALLGELSALEEQLNEAANPTALFTNNEADKSNTLLTVQHAVSPKPLGLPSSSSSPGASSSGYEGSFSSSQRNSLLTPSDQPIMCHVAGPCKATVSSASAMIVSSVRAPSPDSDSAFGDCGSSTLSTDANHANTQQRSNSSAESSRGSINTPSPTQLSDSNPNHNGEKEGVDDDTAKIRAEKIKLALEKMKEANIKKLYVKFYTGEGSKSLMVDERWTVDYVLRQLADKNRVALSGDHALVEYYPDLWMERIYEDHELLIENILLWTRDSPNKVFFVERPDKYLFLHEPHEFLVDPSETHSIKLDADRKQQIVEEFFAGSRVGPPELEGILYLKAEGKKAWKKHYFVLRASGLYYVPKGKSKSSKDLVCLISLEQTQVYYGVEWKKKYKAPTDYGFALKHPQIQVKASKYIKYLCAEDDATFRRWVVGLRIAKNGRQLYDNFEACRTYLETDEAKCASGNVSLRSSASAENCAQSNATNGNSMHSDYSRESVVMRPKSAAVGDVSDIKLRPRSADIVRGNTKRNSRTLMHVDLPTIPSEPEPNLSISSLMIDSSSISSASCPISPARSSIGSSIVSSNSSAIPSMHSWSVRNGSNPPTPRGGGSQTPTPSADPSSNSYAFDSDSTTGTIKRQPQAVGFVLPLNSLRLPFNATPPDCTSMHSSGSSLREHEEPDSDEDLPPPPPELVPQCIAGPSNEVPLPPSAGCLHRPPSQISTGSASKRAPPPPRRSENTKLTTIPPGQPVSPVSPGNSKPALAPKPNSLHCANNGIDMQSELQKAIARRRQKIEDTTSVIEGKEPNGVVGSRKEPNGVVGSKKEHDGPNFVSPAKKVPPPPPPKRQVKPLTNTS